MLNPYAFVSIFAGVISGVLAIYAWRRRPATGSMAFAWLLLAMTIYACAYGLELLSTDLPSILYWIRIEYVGIATIPAIWLILTLQFTGRESWLSSQGIAFLFIVPIIVIVTNHTLQFHNFFYREVSLDTSGSFPMLAFVRGPFYWLHTTYTYFSFVVGYILLIEWFRRAHNPFRSQAGIMLLGGSVPMLVYALYLFGIQPIPHLDLNPYAFTITGLVMTWGLYSYHLLDLAPVARDNLIESLRSGVLVLDSRSRLIDYNPSARDMLNLSGKNVGQPLEEVLQEFPDDLAGALRKMATETLEETLPDVEVQVKSNPVRFLGMRVSPVQQRRGQFIGRLVIITDITRRKQAEVALQTLNIELEMRVDQRNAELRSTIHQLETEIHARKSTEEELQKIRQHLAQQVAEQSRQLTTLYEVILMGGQSLEMNDLMGQSLEKILELFKGKGACLYQRPLEFDTLHLLTQRGMSIEEVNQLEVLPGGWMGGGDLPILVTDVQTNPTLPNPLRLAGFNSIMAAPVHLRGEVTGALVVFWTGNYLFSVEDISLFSAVADQLGIIVENARLRHRIEESAALQERRRLARDLHDSVTQSLHSLTLFADIASNRLRQSNLEGVKATINQLRESSRQALKEMRLLLYEMRLAPLEEVDLVEALQFRLEAVEQRAGIHGQLVVEGHTRWPAAWDGELYCIAMEALNNSLKHGRASEVTVVLSGDQSENKSWVEMDVIDNGQGFDTQNTREGGMGLHNMGERAERLGGILDITSSKAGTRLKLRVGNAGGG